MMPFLVFSQSSFNVAFIQASVVFPPGHAEHCVNREILEEAFLKEKYMNNWILPASVTFICWGIWGFIPKITTRYINPMSAVVYESIGVGIMGFLVFTILGFRPEVHAKGISLAIITGVLGITGALGFLFAVKSGKVSIVAVFTAMSPVITILLAYFLLKEPITVREGLGLICAFAAIYLFST
jgi:transporter family protein